MIEQSNGSQMPGSDNDASREAAAWFARLLDEHATEMDHQGFRAWLLADNRNAQAYARIEKLWERAAFEHKPAEQSGSRRSFLKTATGALVIATAGTSGWLWTRQPDFSTGTGETNAIRLEDGSTIELSAASAVSIDFTPTLRRIVLRSGEAYFTVAPDARRPFVVEAGELRATALGTAYSVSISSGRTSVAVTEHSVRVEAHGQMIDLAEGQALDWAADRFGPVTSSEIDSRLAWRQRRLVFLARPLGEIVEEINRWRNGHLVILDPTLAQRPVTAIIDVNDMADIDKTLEQGLPIALSGYTPYLTLVSAKKI